MKKGDRVIYVSGVHGSADYNPLYKDFGIVGTIIGNPRISTMFRVKWDNGLENSYSKQDLQMYNAIKSKIQEYYV